MVDVRVDVLYSFCLNSSPVTSNRILMTGTIAVQDTRAIVPQAFF
ncbi:hypothetical protein OOK60_03330 [Trichothermofontia sichuanensis B231]|nr:hypothetical protein [Trichothermofontia sichuanensis]UZQ55121.1 hypothetical protein OOK60_03330 [Trichothermofontia sichuanensis B231]